MVHAHGPYGWHHCYMGSVHLVKSVKWSLFFFFSLCRLVHTSQRRWLRWWCIFLNTGNMGFVINYLHFNCSKIPLNFFCSDGVWGPTGLFPLFHSVSFCPFPFLAITRVCSHVMFSSIRYLERRNVWEAHSFGINACLTQSNF